MTCNVFNPTETKFFEIFIRQILKFKNEVPYRKKLGNKNFSKNFADEEVTDLYS